MYECQQIGFVYEPGRIQPERIALMLTEKGLFTAISSLILYQRHTVVIQVHATEAEDEMYFGRFAYWNVQPNLREYRRCLAAKACMFHSYVFHLRISIFRSI